MTRFTRYEIAGLHVLDGGGDGLPCVFLHGVMGRGVSWQDTISALGPRIRGIAIDQRGHGRSPKQGPYDRDAYVGDLERVVDGLGLERFALVGHSTGALNAWVYAARHPGRVAALVLEDMNAARKGGDFLDGWRRWLAGWPLPFASLADVVRHFGATRPALGAYFAELFAEADDGWRPLFSADAVLRTLEGNEARDWWDELAAVRCPTLIVRGERSEWLGQAEAERMRDAVPGARLAVVDDAQHTVHVDQPALYRALVAGFLDEVLGHAVPAAVWSDERIEALARRQYARGDAGFPLTRPALVLIDMQEEFLESTGGPFRIPAAAARVPAMTRLLGAFRERGLPVIHTAFAATHASLDRPTFGACMPNRAAADFDGGHLFREPRFAAPLAPRPGEVVIHKPSYGAFYDTPLETILRRLGVDTVVLAGTLTDCCVGTTARQAYERGFGPVVAADATATSLDETHAAELMILRRAFARVLDVDEILAELPHAAEARL